MGSGALENKLQEGDVWVGEIVDIGSRSRMTSAGRVGSRQGTVSELTLIIPFAEGGAKRLRGLLQLRDGNFDDTDKVGTVHDMRFVVLDNDTKLLFATAFDGEWDPYINDFATKIPDELDMLFCHCEGWPGIHSPSVKDWIGRHQVTAEGWYVATSSMSVKDTIKAQKIMQAFETLLDSASS